MDCFFIAFECRVRETFCTFRFSRFLYVSFFNSSTFRFVGFILHVKIKGAPRCPFSVKNHPLKSISIMTHTAVYSEFAKLKPPLSPTLSPVISRKPCNPTNFISSLPTSPQALPFSSPTLKASFQMPPPPLTALSSSGSRLPSKSPSPSLANARSSTPPTTTPLINAPSLKRNTLNTQYFFSWLPQSTSRPSNVCSSPPTQ